MLVPGSGAIETHKVNIKERGVSNSSKSVPATSREACCPVVTADFQACPLHHKALFNKRKSL